MPRSMLTHSLTPEKLESSLIALEYSPVWKTIYNDLGVYHAYHAILIYRIKRQPCVYFIPRPEHPQTTLKPFTLTPNLTS